MKVLMLLMVGNGRAAFEIPLEDISGYQYVSKKRRKTQEGEGHMGLDCYIRYMAGQGSRR